MDNIIALREELVNKSYRHGGYHAFKINDPKPRQIHKATVRDRIVHRAIYRQLYPFFNSKFIADSYSCRNKRGTHKAVNRFRQFAYKVSQNNTRTCSVLQCDIKRFFDNIDQAILFEILSKYIKDSDAIWLLEKVVYSFNSGKRGKGLPLGNLTSQLLVNIYMNEFDQIIKCQLGIKWYVRYADDFAILSEDREFLEKLIPEIANYLEDRLRLFLHPDKVTIKTLASGVDFLGWIVFPDHRIMRTKTKNRMIKRLQSNKSSQTLNSYLGLLSHGNTKKLRSRILNHVRQV